MAFENGMVCPYCVTTFAWTPGAYAIGQDADFTWHARSQVCPACHRMVVACGQYHKNDGRLLQEILVYPKTAYMKPLSADVPQEFAQDYNEARLVLMSSPKASAALSRRCLQNILREKAGVRKPNLAQEIEAVVKSNQLPSYLATAIDAIRHLGNFAAHPTKDTNTGEIVNVEPGEAEWLLDLLEGLFDFYFVQPAEMQRKRDALNAKLTAAGKQPMK